MDKSEKRERDRYIFFFTNSANVDVDVTGCQLLFIFTSDSLLFINISC